MPTPKNSLYIGDEQVKVEAIYHQIQVDIETLQKQIAELNDSDQASQELTQNYQYLLECRLSVSQWLNEYRQSQSSFSSKGRRSRTKDH